MWCFVFLFYLEHREDGCWEGIKVCCWSFIFKVKPKKDSQQHNYKLKKTTTPKPLEQMLKTRFQSGLNGLYLQFRKVTWINGIKKRKLWGTIHVSGHEKHESTKKDRFTLQSQLDHFLHFVSHLQHPHHTHICTSIPVRTFNDHFLIPTIIKDKCNL